MTRGLIWCVALIVICGFVQAECITSQQADAFDSGATVCTGDSNALPDDHQGRAEFPDGGTVTHRGNVYEMEAGGALTANQDGSVDIEKVEHAETTAGTTAEGVERAELRQGEERYNSAERVERQDVVLEEAEAAVLETSSDNVRVERAQRVRMGEILAHNAQRVSRKDGVVVVGRAEKIELPDGILTQVQDFEGQEIAFEIGAARDVLLGCIAMRQVRDSAYRINEKSIEIRAGPSVEFDIADCGFAQNHFKATAGGSELVISKSKRAQYQINGGELSCRSPWRKETISTAHSATIQYGSSCFSCLTLSPESTYWYNGEGEDIAQDFGVRIPSDAPDFKLCLKKQALDYFTVFDGLVDFTENKISLTKMVEYLRYPFKDGQPASLLMNRLVVDKENFRVRMQLDEDFTFVEELAIASNVNNQTEQAGNSDKTATRPSNYLEIRETSIDGNLHRLARLDFRLPAKDLTQERVRSYGTGYMKPKALIANNTLVQKTFHGRVVMLRPDDRSIARIVGNEQAVVS